MTILFISSTTLILLAKWLMKQYALKIMVGMVVLNTFITTLLRGYCAVVWGHELFLDVILAVESISGIRMDFWVGRGLIAPNVTLVMHRGFLCTFPVITEILTEMRRNTSNITILLILDTQIMNWSHFQH